jgi:hypothetical protein
LQQLQNLPANFEQKKQTFSIRIQPSGNTNEDELDQFKPLMLGFIPNPGLATPVII